MTSSRIISNIIYIFSLVFLVASIISFIVNGEGFSLNTFVGTDALTLYGMIIAFLSLLAMKSNWIRKLIRSVLLKLNFKKFNYEMNTVLDTNIDINKLAKVIQLTLKNTSHYNENEVEVLNKSETLTRFFSSGMGVNITIKKQKMTTDYQRDHVNYENRFKLEFKGKDDYKSFKKNSDFILNILFDTLQKEGMDFNKYYLKVRKRSDDYNYLNENYLLIDKSFEITYSETHIEKAESTVEINKTDGITIRSRSKGEFHIALGLLEDLLVS